MLKVKITSTFWKMLMKGKTLVLSVKVKESVAG